MKPLYLEFCGINSFSETAKIDFEKLLSGGVFGIFGDTGSGKSTILDSIHFALYGKIERASGVDSINYQSDKATVLFEFELTEQKKRKRFGVTRERRRKNNVVKAAFYEYDETGAKLALAEGAEEVNKKVEDVLGLSFDDFKKCIALPQGEFSSLVKATNAERVKLVSRIFDLEKYGDRLSAKIRAKHDFSKGEAEKLLARMGENQTADGEDENSEGARLQELKNALANTEGQIDEVEKEYFAQEKKIKAKKEYETLCETLAEYELKRPLYEQKKELLEILPKAQATVVAYQEKLSAEKAFADAKLDREKTELACAKAEAKKAELLAQIEQSDLSGKLEQARNDLAILQTAQTDVLACEQAKKRLDECLLKYKATDKHYEKEDFDALIKKLETELEKLGEDLSFSEYLLDECKDVLLADTYAEFRKDLRELSKKYPATAGDVQTLVEKYTPYGVGSEKSFDVANAKLQFDERSKRRKETSAKLDGVKKRKELYETNEREKELIAKEGRIYRDEYERAKEKIADVEKLGTLKDAEEKLERLKKQISAQEEEQKTAETNAISLAAAVDTKRQIETLAQKSLDTATEKLKGSLLENGFVSETDAREKLLSVGSEEQTRKEVDSYFSKLGAIQMRKNETDENAFWGANEELVQSLSQKKNELVGRKTELVGLVAVSEQKIEQIRILKEKYKALETQYKAVQAECGRWDKLRQLIDKNKFMSFIASEYLQEICVSASGLLLSLTGGRYYLRYDGEFKAVDNLNGGVYRSVKTLSGGETFLVSLSLALSLSAAICEKSLRPIEFFFLDEGFGTLDEKLVDVVMDSLDKLKSNHFSIGLISHVEELKHRIENKILVSGATNSHGSTVKTEILA